MRIRHKVPAIFSLSMVDMLCCALGCVILVWLLNAKQSEDLAEERQRETDELRARADQDHAASVRLLADAKSEYDRVFSRVRELNANIERMGKESARLTEEIKSRSTSEKDLRSQLALEKERNEDLERRLTASVKRTLSLEASMRETTTKLTEAEIKGKAIAAEMATSTTTARTLKTDLARVEALLRQERERAGKLESSLAAGKREAEALEKKLSGTEKMRVVSASELALLRERLDALEKDRSKIQGSLLASQKLRDDDLARWEKERKGLRLAADNRFAGIALTGRRVIFLVDSSASMEYVDRDTMAPNKWKEVASTVAKLLKSLPDVEKFQVINFAYVVGYPLGQPGKWLDADKFTPERVQQAVASVKPDGGTNMYAGMEAAFQFRDQGLDTIYLLSDGLPTQGAGLDAEQAKLTGVARAELLGKHVRKTLTDKWNNARKGSPRVKINTIGFFYESPDLGAFLWSLSRENEGSFVGMNVP